MKSLKGTKTEENLLKSFAGESQARMRYDYFAKQAIKEGFEQIAAIFSETFCFGSTTRNLSMKCSKLSRIRCPHSLPV